LVRAGKTENNYTFRTRSSEMVRSSLAFIKDEFGRVFGAIEINLDTGSKRFEPLR
jgi:predicted transcriptional regulator YheO